MTSAFPRAGILETPPRSSANDHSFSSPSSAEDELSPGSRKSWTSKTNPSKKSQQEAPSTTTSPTGFSNNDDQSSASKLPPPLQKRRRVTRACDECRRKKIKCDGKQPCTHCTVYSYDCTYDQPSNRRRNPAPQYIEHLEHKLHKMESLLKVLLPGVDLDKDLDVDRLAQLKQKLGARSSSAGAPGASGNFLGPSTQQQQTPIQSCLPSGRQDALLESMVEAAGKLEIDERGNLDFHGHSSGFTFLQKLREEFGDLLGKDLGSSTLLLRAPQLSTVVPSDSPFSSRNSPSFDSFGTDTVVLPPRDVAQLLVNATLNEACIFFRFIHRPTFDAMFNRMYELESDDYGNLEYKFLPVLYLSLAVGCVFADPEKYAEKYGGFTNGTAEGTKYFLAGRRLVEITDCRDITSIQCVILMILFFQSSAKLSTCYSFLSIAISASVRMGMHRKLTISDPLDGELRKRIFFTIKKMDTYVGTLLGLPRGIQVSLPEFVFTSPFEIVTADLAIDRTKEYPLELDDQYITREGLLRAPEGAMSSIAAANAHTKLLKILAKIVKSIYPIKGLQMTDSGKRSSYMVTYASIREIEEELDNWQDDLPMFLRPGDDAPVRFIRSQHLLQMSLAHTKMMLYRPFLHYVSTPKEGKIVGDERPYACAAACINVCREIVHICDTMRQKGILNGAYWFNIYTAFFSIISLVYFVLENVSHPDAPEILKEATLGKDCLLSVKDRSMAAERCSTSLKGLFEQLPNQLKSGFESAVSKKKRARGVSPAVDYSESTSEPKSGVQGTENKTNLSQRTSNFTSTPDTAETIPSHLSSNGLAEAGNPIYQPDSGVSSPDHKIGQSLPDHISFQQHLGASGGMPDLNALMFPTSESFGFGMQSGNQDDSTYYKLLPGDSFGFPSATTRDERDSSALDGLEVQLFGPFQPYFQQDQLFEQGNMPSDYMNYQLSSPQDDTNTMNLDMAFDEITDQQRQQLNVMDDTVTPNDPF